MERTCSKEVGKALLKFFALNIFYTFEFFTSNPTRPAQQTNSTVNFVGVAEKSILKIELGLPEFCFSLSCGKSVGEKNPTKKQVLGAVECCSRGIHMESWAGGGLFFFMEFSE